MAFFIVAAVKTSNPVPMSSPLNVRNPLHDLKACCSTFHSSSRRSLALPLLSSITSVTPCGNFTDTSEDAISPPVYRERNEQGSNQPLSVQRLTSTASPIFLSRFPKACIQIRKLHTRHYSREGDGKIHFVFSSESTDRSPNFF
jgi:hypothetical protein